MIEKMKTYLLTLLVVFSLIQSYYLAFGQPDFQPILNTGDVTTTWVGDKREISNLIEPSQITLHFGNGRNQVLNQQQVFFEEIFNKLKRRTFDEFREVQFTEVDWNDTRNQNKGFELRFSTGVPISVLGQVLQIQGEFRNKFDYISTILVTTSPIDGLVKAYFITDESNRVFEAAKVDLIVKDVEQITGWGQKLNQLNNYVWTNDSYYLPEKSIFINKLVYEYVEVTSAQLQSSLFLEPTIGRKLLEQNGKEIYTDGKSGLKIDRQLKWFIYNDPISVPDDSTSLTANLSAAIQFINLHGGWGGEYILSEMPEDIEQPYGFTQYINSYPVISSNPSVSNGIQMIMKNGSVTNFERGMITIDTTNFLSSESIRLPGKAELLANNKEYLLNAVIKDIYPVYVMNFLPNQMVELVPKWAAKKVDGSIRILD